MRGFCATAVVAVALAAPARGRRAVTEYEIKLDSPPAERYNALLPRFNATVWNFWDKYFRDDKALTGVLFGLADLRGPEGAEQQAEIEGLAAQSRLPLKFVQ